MSFLEKRVVPAILKTIRTRRKASKEQGGDTQASSAGAVQPAKLREANFSDYAAVTELKRRWGLTADSLENWERLWKQNPALEKVQAERPIGWVLEAEAGVVGYLGNISSTYYYGSKRLEAVTSSGLVVEPAYRSVSLSLISAFYRQKSVDLFLVTTAIPAVGKLARAFKSEPLPQPDYETVLFWVLQPRPFAEGVIKKLEIQSALAPLGSLVGSLAVRMDTLFRNRKPKQSKRSFTVSEIRVEQIGDDFEQLWEQKLKEGPRLFADRRPCTLKWHYQIPGDTGVTSVLCCREQKELRGYAVLRSGTSRMNGLKRSMIADLLVEQNDPEAIRALLVAAYDYARRQGSHTLEVLGFPHSIREVCSEGNPYLRKYPACPFYYKGADATFHKTLLDENAWYATPFDGDTTLMP